MNNASIRMVTLLHAGTLHEFGHSAGSWWGPEK